MKRLSVLLVLLCAAPVWAANLLTNPSFDTPTGTWDYVDTGWTGVNASRQTFHPRTGARHAGFDGTISDSSGSVYQDVLVTTGVYTFSVWIRLEASHAPTNHTEMKIEWYNASTVAVQSASVAVYSNVPPDNRWHHVYVVGTCDVVSLAFVRPTLTMAWEKPLPSGYKWAFAEDAELFEGNAYLGSERHGLWSPGFEQGRPDPWWERFEEQPWERHYSGADGGCTRETWGWGDDPRPWVLAFKGWESNDYFEVSQSVLPTVAGTNSFVFWVIREPAFALSNLEVRIEWYDRTFTNKVQSDTKTNFYVGTLATNAWQMCWVAGVGTSPALHEARATFFVQWGKSDNALKIEDARLLSGPAFEGLSSAHDWSYHNDDAAGYWRTGEEVPGTNVGAFLLCDFDAGSNTVYVLADKGSHSSYPEETDNGLFVRVAWDRPGWDWPTNAVRLYEPMTYVGDVTIPDSDPFHGLPASGAKTVELYRYQFSQPRDIDGSLLTNTLWVFYAPYYELVYGDVTSMEWLVRNDGEATNNLGQQVRHGREAYIGRDYAYFNSRPVWRAAFTNASFDNPPDEYVYDNSGWVGFGDTFREPWTCVRSGPRGVRFGQGHQTNMSAGGAGVYQDITGTAGVYTFAIWMKQQIGARATNNLLKMEYFSSIEGPIQQDTKRVPYVPDGCWHLYYITSTSTLSGTHRVRPVFSSEWGAGAVPFESSIGLDDAEFYGGQYTSRHALANGGFEAGREGERSYLLWHSTWDGVPCIGPTEEHAQGLVGWEEWGRRSSLENQRNVGVFRCWTTNRHHYGPTLSQGFSASTGTHTFSVWLLCEKGVLLESSQLRVEWRDETITNVLQTDTLDILLPNDEVWYQYWMTVTNTNPNAFEARPIIAMGWGPEGFFEGRDAIKVDDAIFAPGGPRTGDVLSIDWTYYSGGASNPAVEQVPGTNVGAFLQVSYATTTTTFYVLSDSPDFSSWPDNTHEVWLRTAWFPPEGGDKVELYTNLTRIGSVTIPLANKFHGLPTGADKTLDLWKYVWTQPLTTNVPPEPRTNAIWIFYAPFLKVGYGGALIDFKFLADPSKPTTLTNNYLNDPQEFADNYSDADYGYENRWYALFGDSDGDGIPDEWELRHFPNLTTSGIGSNSDADVATDLEEYIADTDPNNAASVFPNIITNLSGRGVLQLFVGPPTTNTRRYDVWWNTNLLTDTTWTPFNFNVPGDVNGAAVVITVSNGPPAQGTRHFITGVKLPP